jgi:hypothetical protein
MSLPTLNDLGLKYNTDKATYHTYTLWYPKYFESIRHNQIDLLEIGVYAGGSLRMWNEYFDHPDTRILGLDINSHIDFQTDRVITRFADQSNREQLARAIGDKKFDIILDDGGHFMEQQLISWGFLFKYLKPNGFYVVEDICTSHPLLYEMYNKGYSKENNTLNEFKNLRDNKRLDNTYMTEDEKAYILANAADMDLYEANPMKGGFASMSAVIKHRF